MNFLLFSAVYLALTFMCSAKSPQQNPFDSHDESFFLWPDFRMGHGRDKIVFRNCTQQKCINWSGISYCFNGTTEYNPHKDITSAVIQNLSTCPWFWQLNYDETRTPALLMMAKCSCSECQGPDHPPEARCEEIFYLRKVTYHKGTNREEEKLFRLPVGCTCFRGKRQHHAESEQGEGSAQ